MKSILKKLLINANIAMILATLAGPALAQSALAARDRNDVVNRLSAAALRTIAGPAVREAAQPMTDYELSIAFADLATVHLAMYDAAVAIQGGYRPYAAESRAPMRGVSMDAAIGAAGCHVLAGLRPESSASFGGTCEAFRFATDAAERAGLAIGIAAGASLLAERAEDGRDSEAGLRPFALDYAMQFRAPGPPAPESAQYAEDFDETRELGSVTAESNDDERLAVTRFHSEDPVRFWARNVATLIESEESTFDRVRAAAMFATAQADAAIACLESARHYASLRPADAIAAADTDGNPATQAEAGWTPATMQAEYAEYPALAACVGAASAHVLSALHRHDPFEFDLADADGVLRHYTSTAAYLLELVRGQIDAGLHFRSSLDDGAALGRRVGLWVTRLYFRSTAIRGDSLRGLR